MRLPADILDWQLAESDEELILTIQHQDGELVEYEIEKDYDETLGIIFASTLDRLRICQNRRLFCFGSDRRSCAKLYTQKMMIIACLSDRQLHHIN